MEFWGKKSFCLITGASRGIGKAIATEFAQKIDKDSLFLLVARSKDALEDVKLEVLATAPLGVQVAIYQKDLEKPDATEFLSMINSVLSLNEKRSSDFDHAILVHNAASLGKIRLRTSQMESLEDLRTYYDLNVFSVFLLTSQFLKVFATAEKQRSIINISSYGAIQPINCLSVYCSAKSARNMLMKMIASEEPSISTLSYGPGVVDTGMYKENVENCGDETTVKMFKQMKSKNLCLSPIQTVTKLIGILAEKKYIGEHIDYYENYSFDL